MFSAAKKWQHVCDQQLFHPSVLPRHVDRRSSRLLPHYRVREFVGGGGGGLTERRKLKSSLLRPPLPLFPEIGRKKGGGNSGAVQYILQYSKYRRLGSISLLFEISSGDGSWGLFIHGVILHGYYLA